MEDVKVEDIAQDVKKITDEELKSVQEKVNKINQAQMTVGGLEVQKGIALQTIGALQVELQTIQKELEEKLKEIDVTEEAQDLDKWNKWVEAAEQEVAKEEEAKDKDYVDTKNRIFYGEEVKQIDEAQKKTAKGSNYITKVSNKQIRQQTNPEDSDQT